MELRPVFAIGEANVTVLEITVGLGDVELVDRDDSRSIALGHENG